MKATAFLFLVLAGQLVLAQDPTKGEGYFPLKEGSSWTYAAVGKQFVTTVKSYEKVGDDNCAILETRTGKDLVSSEYVAARKEGIFRVQFSGKKIVPALCFLKLPFKSGENWKFDSKVDDKDTKGTFTFGEAKGVQVKAGKYDTITVTSKDMKVDGQGVTITYYFAKDVGMVKQTIVIGTTTFDMELEKYEPKK